MNYMIPTMKELVDKLNVWRDSYYNHDISLVSDREYDAQFDRLVELEKKTGIILSGSPTQTVGYTVSSKLEKVKHSHPLLSLDKTTDADKFAEYFKDHDCVVMAKLDGLTCSITYKDGELFRAETRGNGEIGEDITQNVRMFANLPITIPYSGELTVDGECIITKDEFDRINARENTLYKNPRNLVSGTVRQLNNEVVKKRNVKFIAWKLHSFENKKINSHYRRLINLERLGFDVVPNYCALGFTKDTEMIKKYIELIKNDCDEKLIPIDGIVGMFDDIEYGESLGMTGHHPKHSLAFKFYQEENETILRDIEWSTSRTGLVNPVAIFDPVEIDGTTVSRATLNNVSVIEELELGIGDTITVIKANQIIPMVTQNLTRSNTYKIPDICPSCGQKLVIKNDNGRKTLVCDNSQCFDKLLDKFTNFVSRQGMDINGLSESRLSTLIRLRYIHDFADLYKLHEYTHLNDLISENGFGSRILSNILIAIENSRQCKLANVITAIGIPGVGKSTAKILAKYCEDICIKDKLTRPLAVLIDLSQYEMNWTSLPTIGEITSKDINNYINNNIYELVDLEKELNIIIDNAQTGENSLNGKTFCITGKLEHFKNRADLVSHIESCGGKVTSSVTAKTTYLINNDKESNSSKNKSAKKFGTEIISEYDYIKMFMNNSD